MREGGRRMSIPVRLATGIYRKSPRASLRLSISKP